MWGAVKRLERDSESLVLSLVTVAEEGQMSTRVKDQDPAMPPIVGGGEATVVEP